MPAEPFLQIAGMCKRFPPATAALRDVTLSLEEGRILGLVGPSGCGKSTLARCLARFETPDAGSIRLEGTDLTVSPRDGRVQLIFQDAAASLNPRFTAGEIVSEPLLIQKRGNRRAREQAAARWMAMVGLPPEAAGKPALAFSGGERQRLAIARALAIEPKLLILDESLSGLDLALQAQISTLLLDLQQKLGLTAILISHDLALVSRVADEIAVMDAGTVVEHASTAEIMARPRHSRTRELLEASLAVSLGGGA